MATTYTPYVHNGVPLSFNGAMMFYKTDVSSGGGGSTLLNDIVAYWKFDEVSGNAIDSFGSLNGIVGDVSQNEVGKIEKAYLFKGPAGRSLPDTTNGVFMPNNSAFDLASRGSLSVWLTNELGAYQRGFIAGTQQSDTTSGYGILLDVTGTGGFQQIVTFIGNTSQQVKQTDSATINHDGTVWYHVIMTWDVDNNLVTYVNGSVSNTTEITITPTDRDGQFTVGINDNEYNPYWHKGKIDEIGVWSRALTSDEVTQLYNSGNGLSYDSF